MDIHSAIQYGMKKLGLSYLKDKQKEAVEMFLQGDTVVALPTGYGKSVIFAILPYVFDNLRGKIVTYSIVLLVA